MLACQAALVLIQAGYYCLFSLYPLPLLIALPVEGYYSQIRQGVCLSGVGTQSTLAGAMGASFKGQGGFS